MRETSLDEFVDRDDGGADDGSEDDETRRGTEVESAVESEASAVEPEASEGEPVETEGESGESEGGPVEPATPETENEDGAEREEESKVDAEPEPDPEPDPESEPDLEQTAEPDAVEPAVSTYDWTPSGADCEACGTAVERRWRDDGRLVCAECKAW